MTDKKVIRCKELLKEGIRGNDLIKQLMAEFNISAFGADWVIKEAMDEFEKEESVKVIQDNEAHLIERLKIYKEAINEGDKETALKVLQDIAKLQGVYENKQDNKIEIEFLFPNAVGYRPLSREIMMKMLEMTNENNNSVQTAQGSMGGNDR